MKSFRSLAVAAAALAFLLAILGSWVRINGAGMTCPDWPLCKGSLIPSLHGGVILEWSHRLVAAIEGLVLIGALITGWRARTTIAGVSPVLGALGIIFVIQIALGGLTVQLSNRPDSVVWHWATAMAFLAALTVLATLAQVQPKLAPRPNTIAIALALAALAAFATMSAGAYVSSSGAGLACNGLPGCGADFWGINTLQRAQMLHRGLAALFALLGAGASILAMINSPKARPWASLGLVLLIVQIGLGMANIIKYLPTDMREAHAANAVLTFLVYIIAATMAAIEASSSPLRSTIATVRGEIPSSAQRIGRQQL